MLGVRYFVALLGFWVVAVSLPAVSAHAKPGYGAEGQAPDQTEPLDVHQDLVNPPPNEAAPPAPEARPTEAHPVASITPLSSSPASAAVVRRAVGQVHYRIDRCQAPGYFNNLDERIVQATVDRVPSGGLAAHDGLLDALLLDAARYAWRTCPQPYVWIDGRATGDFHYDVGLVQINGPAGGLASAKLGGEPLTLYGDQPLASSRTGYQWRDYHDLAAENQAAQEQANQQQQAAAARSEQQQTSYQQGQRNQSHFFSQLLTWAFIGFLIWLATKWEEIARWFYSLQPHPARGLVDAAIHHGAPINGALYQQIIDQTGGGRIENEVRTRQANELTASLRRHEAALRSESERRVRAEQERVDRENAFKRAHLELLRAGVSHEEAAARLDELKRNLRIVR